MTFENADLESDFKIFVGPGPDMCFYNKDHNILKWLSVALQSLFSSCHWRDNPKLLANCAHRDTTSSWRRLKDIAISISPKTK